MFHVPGFVDAPFNLQDHVWRSRSAMTSLNVSIFFGGIWYQLFSKCNYRMLS